MSEQPALCAPERDVLGDRLDELAVIGAAYTAAREAGRPVFILRRALIDACKDTLAELDNVPVKRSLYEVFRNINEEKQSD